MLNKNKSKGVKNMTTITENMPGVFGAEARINDLVRSIAKEFRGYLTLENKSKKIIWYCNVNSQH